MSTKEEKYINQNRRSGKVIKPNHEEDDIINNNGQVRASLENELGEISPDNPLPTGDFDGSHRGSVNSIFGDKIIGTRVPSIAAQFQYGLRSDDAVVDVVTTGITAISDAMLLLNTGIAADGHVGIQGSDYLRYIPGHEAYAFFTCVFASPVEGLTQRIGIFDFDGGNGNGFFIGFNGLDFGYTRRRAGVDIFIPVDVSGVFPDPTEHGIFDPTKGNVYKISYGYLGFATIHFEILLPHGGFVEFASIDYPNTSTETHIANTNIPLRAEMTNSGSVVDSQLKIGSVSAGIVDGGGADPIARNFSFEGGVTDSGIVQLFTFRNKAQFFGLTNKITSQLSLITASTEGNKPVAWRIIKNPDIITPGVFTDINIDSIMEYSVDQVNDLSTGTLLIPWKMGKADSFFEKVEDLILRLRPNDYAVIVADTGLVSSELALSMRWKELF